MQILGPRVVLALLASLFLGAPLSACRARPCACAELAAAVAAHGAVQDDEVIGPKREEVDVFHPERAEEVQPAYGGTVIVHLPGLPQSVNYAIENSAYSRWMLFEIHAFLMQRDWELWDLEPVVARSWVAEDALVPKQGGGDAGGVAPGVVYGRVTDGGDHWLVTPASPGNPLEGPVEVPKGDVASVERGTVVTVSLRDDVEWHDGHPFDARDVRFSWSIYANPGIDCDSIRPYYERITACEVVDPHTVRFYFEEQYFRVLDTIADMTLLPAHLYDLGDPDHPRHDPDASQEARAREVNENPHNTDWVGLGPYRMTTWSQQYVEAKRFDGYFDPADGGYVDVIRWRHIRDDNTAFQALINGELDFLYRIGSDDYFGESTQRPEFTDKYYKGYYYVGAFNYTPWNMRRPLFSDARVRRALAHAFDFEDYRRTIAHGLAKLPTGPQLYFGPAYDHGVERLEYSLQTAEELLAEAGWYDRDGDGVIDKDGVPFEFELLAVSGNKAGRQFAQKLQESLAALGIKVNVAELEWASYLERVYDREFDAASLAWSLDVPESDPVQLWHSSGAKKGVRGSNHPGVADPYVDELIAKGRRELDDEKRWATWRELHRYLYEEVQPYLYRLAPPRKFGMNKEIRGLQTFKINPGFSIRRWYYPAGTPGTRATRAR